MRRTLCSNASSASPASSPSSSFETNSSREETGRSSNAFGSSIMDGPSEECEERGRRAFLDELLLALEEEAGLSGGRRDDDDDEDMFAVSLFAERRRVPHGNQKGITSNEQ